MRRDTAIALWDKPGSAADTRHDAFKWLPPSTVHDLGSPSPYFEYFSPTLHRLRPMSSHGEKGCLMGQQVRRCPVAVIRRRLQVRKTVEIGRDKADMQIGFGANHSFAAQQWGRLYRWP